MSETNPYQELLEQLQACESQEERDWLSLCFSIAQLPKELQAAVRAAAVPRFFDRAFLNALLDQPLDEEQFVQLLEQSYIEPYPGEERFNVHERSRRLLQERLWQEDEALYREISRRAFAYCQEQDQDDTTWRIETIYHQLIAEPGKGIIAFEITCIDWIKCPSLSSDRTESLVRAVREHQELSRLSEKAVHYYWLNQSRIHIRCFRYQEAKQSLGKISLSHVERDSYLTINCLEYLGRVHTLFSEFPEAELFYQEALRRYRITDNWCGENICLLGLARIYLALLRVNQARRNFEKVLMCCRGDQLIKADSFLGLGNVYLVRSNLNKAWSFCNKALKLYKKIGSRLGKANCYYVISEIYLRRSELLKAQKQCGEAMSLYSKIDDRVGEANSLKLFGEIEVKAKNNFFSAQKYYIQASTLFERIQCWEGVAECLEGFAKLHQAQGQRQQAEEYWQKAAGKYHELTMPLRAEKCLEKLRQLKEQDKDMTKQKNKNN